MSISSEERVEQIPAEAGITLAAFYDKRAPAALAYCARACPPEEIADAVEASFARLFQVAASTDGADLEELDACLRAAVRAESVARTPPPESRGRRFDRGARCEDVPRLLAAQAAGELSETDAAALDAHMPGCAECRSRRRAFEEAERAYDSLSGDDAPALGRPLVAELVGELPPPASLDRRIAEWLGGAAVEEPAAPPPPPPPPPPPAPPLSERARELAARAGSSTAHAARRAIVVLRALAPFARRARRHAIALLAMLGVLMLLDVALTLVWKEPITAFLTSQAQDDLSSQLASLDREPQTITPTQARLLAAIRDPRQRDAKRMALLAQRLEVTIRPGHALGRLEIKRIGINFVLVQGTGAPSLRKGPGHYQTTGLPGEGRAVGIAGHRTTYEAPFRSIDALRAGDRIVLRMPYGVFTYAVTGHRIVGANDRSEFVGPAGERLFLSACHPLFSATHRIVVDARLLSAQPLGQAVQLPPAAPAGAQPPKPATPPRSSADRRAAGRLAALGNRELVRGVKGKDVKELQRLLGVPSTGFFGSDTMAAVIAFQRSHHLPSTGTVGSRTKRLLAHRTHPPALPPTPANVAPAPRTSGTSGRQGRFTPGTNGGGQQGTTGSPSRP